MVRPQASCLGPGEARMTSRIIHRAGKRPFVREHRQSPTPAVGSRRAQMQAARTAAEDAYVEAFLAPVLADLRRKDSPFGIIPIAKAVLRRLACELAERIGHVDTAMLFLGIVRPLWPHADQDTLRAIRRRAADAQFGEAA